MRRAAAATAPARCRPSLVVLDFDGTLTDADAHAPAFLEASRRALAARLAWDEATLRRAWEAEHAVVTAWPPEAPWLVNDVPACPANADPYLTANSIVRRLLARHAGLVDPELAAGVMDVHRLAYEQVPPDFRADARALLEGLLARQCRIGVVTNSSTRTVERLLDALALRDRAALLVRGDAAKFSIAPATAPDARFTALPVTVEWPELARPVHLQRGPYFDALVALWRQSGAGPAATLVVGDNFELDLAMPAALGAHVHLALRASTMPHEIRLARAMARGDADARLVAVLERIEG